MGCLLAREIKKLKNTVLVTHSVVKKEALWPYNVWSLNMQRPKNKSKNKNDIKFVILLKLILKKINETWIVGPCWRFIFFNFLFGHNFINSIMETCQWKVEERSLDFSSNIAKEKCNLKRIWLIIDQQHNNFTFDVLVERFPIFLKYSQSLMRWGVTTKNISWVSEKHFFTVDILSQVKILG